MVLNKFKSVYQYLIKADVEQRPVRDVYDFVTDSEIMFACAIEAIFLPFKTCLRRLVHWSARTHIP